MASFCVCTAFFVVVGIQFWGTSYMILTIGVSSNDAMVAYSFITITAPILGLIVSGFLLDYMGGYKGANKVKAMKLMFAFTMLSFIVTIPTCLVSTFGIFVPLLWLEIFFGACNIPARIGIVMDSVNRFLVSPYFGNFRVF